MSDEEQDEEEIARIKLIMTTKETPLTVHKAAMFNNVAALTKWLDNAAMDKLDEYQKTPLHYAVERDFVNIIELLLSRNVNVNKPGFGGRTPLHLACMKGCRNAVAKLLEHPKIELDVKDEAGNTPLHYAALNGSLRIVDCLLTAGAKLNSLSNTGASVLHMAILGFSEPVITMLLDKGLQIAISDNSQSNAMHWAAQVQNVALIETLHDSGLDLNQANKAGKTAFDLVQKHVKGKVEEMIKGKECDVADS